MNQNNELNSPTSGVLEAKALPKLSASNIWELIGTTTLVALATLGALYYWSEQIIDKHPETSLRESLPYPPSSQDNLLVSSVANDLTVVNLRSQGTSDTIESIDLDLKNTDLNNLTI